MKLVDFLLIDLIDEFKGIPPNGSRFESLGLRDRDGEHIYCAHRSYQTEFNKPRDHIESYLI